ncbi:3-dehydroquinate synthase [Priestia flexa]|uniref:3-dehydroquinate synthase n=1 Tax=Priestia flexa TaxID=86664 RepID=A0A8I1MDB3_9BACI|nr:3-dehydroquinate synthase [Priestia flexa]MBN8250222.1 3-dehydroquinate synthase [Priestia flexa]UIR29134.1 3-dehydroquinate synthase [Priestia flexa]UZW67604.1 3-dehydroquinate synthase [Priestia flexa]
MEQIQIETKSKTYPLYLGENILSKLPSVIESVKPNASQILVLTDEAVNECYGDKMMDALSSYSTVYKYVLPSGEQAKSFEHYYACQTFALEKQLDRNALIIAFGGGVIGDLAGFVAATYMRGISFIQVPTTLLAHDSAVGGKVAINHELGKNMIGAFFQPEAVFYDIELLNTLPEKEWRSGFAEVIKHALIHDVEFYQWMKTTIKTLSDLRENALIHALKKGISVKAAIVKEDEMEAGVRAHLNFGHTLGHAIESECGYGKISHGEAVAIGMLFAMDVSNALGKTAFPVSEIASWFKQFGYQTSIPSHLEKERLLKKMQADKKSKQSDVYMVLLEEIGQPYVQKVEDDLILNLLSQQLENSN